jgi:hypothetical protein
VHHTATGQRIVFAPGASDMSDDALRIVLRHELFHFVSRAQTALDAPRWLTEGVADFVGRDDHMAYVRAHETKQKRNGKPVKTYADVWREPVRDDFGLPTGQLRALADAIDAELVEPADESHRRYRHDHPRGVARRSRPTTATRDPIAPIGRTAARSPRGRGRRASRARRRAPHQPA